MRPVIEKLIQKKKFRQDSDIIDFFISLGAAVTTENYDVIGKCWALPSYVLSDHATRTLATSDDLEKYFGEIKRSFKTEGVAGVRPEVLGQQWLTDQILIVTLRWSQLDSNNHEIGEETAIYNLKADTNGKLKIHVLTQGLNKPFNMYF